MRNITEKCFYTVLITVLLILAVLLPIILTRTGKRPQRIYLKSNGTASEEEDKEAADELDSPEELSKHLDDFVEQHNLAFIKRELGRTNGGNPIEQIVLKKKPTDNMAIIASGLQANDWSGPPTMIHIMHRFFGDTHGNSSVLKKLEFHFLPLMNPDGYQYSKSSPIRSNWVNNKNGQPVLDGFGNGTAEEVKMFKHFVKKNKKNIRAAFFLFTPKPVNYTSGSFAVLSENTGNNTSAKLNVPDVVSKITQERKLFFKYSKNVTAEGRIDQWIAKEVTDPPVLVIDFMANFKPGAPEYLRKTTRKYGNDIYYIIKSFLEVLAESL